MQGEDANILQTPFGELPDITYSTRRYNFKNYGQCFVIFYIFHSALLFTEELMEDGMSSYLPDGQSVMNPASSFYAIHSTRILCTKNTFILWGRNITILQQISFARNRLKRIWSQVGVIWGGASGTIAISLLSAPLHAALPSHQCSISFSFFKAAIQVVTWIMDICKLKSESSILSSVRWYLPVFQGVREQNIFKHASSLQKITIGKEKKVLFQYICPISLFKKMCLNIFNSDSNLVDMVKVLH